jgi:NAD(P)-dependent dehydrogenase (short-subunit alcohol dehydrogenase family)
MNNELSNKIALITGATSGIGRETAIGLAHKGATVVFTYRDTAKAEQLKSDILSRTGNTDIHGLKCELSSLASVRQMAAEFRSKFGRLHTLINNAGTWEKELRLSTDGIEMDLAVNYFAPFLLTNLLLDIIKESEPARIVNMVSGLYRRGRIDLRDLENRKRFRAMQNYANSKLALLLFTKTLALRLYNTKITVNAASPGMTHSGLDRHAPFLQKLIFNMMAGSPEKAAHIPLFLASSSIVEELSGEYFEGPRPKATYPVADNLMLGEKLWAYTETLLAQK